MNSISNLFWRFINAETGPKTIHFWAPMLQWSFPLQGYLDRNRPPENISRDFQAVFAMYSVVFMRFAWMVKPRNYFLFGLHFFNALFQFNILIRRLRWEKEQAKLGKPIH